MSTPAGDPAPTFLVDGRPVRGIPGPAITAAQILAAAGYDADDVALYADGSHGRRFAPEEAIPVQDGSRFVTGPL